MKRYRTVKTSLGHRFRVEMKPEEIRERRLMGLAVTVIPFLSGLALFGIWVSGV